MRLTKKRKIRPIIKHLLLCLALLTVVVIVLNRVPVFVKLNGEKEMNIEVFSDFTDPGAYDPLTNRTIDSSGIVDTDTIGTYILKYRNGLQTIKRTINVVDTTPPEIEIDGRDLFILLNEDFDIPVAAADDNYDESSDLQIQVESFIDNTHPGTYNIVYRASDSSGNTAEEVLYAYVIADDYDYCDSIGNSTNIDSKALSIIKEFMNVYYRSLKYLEIQDFSYLFTADDNLLFEAALSSLVEYRSGLNNDLRLDDCSYSLRIEEVWETRSGYRIYILEDASMLFHYLDGIETRTNDIGILFEITEENGIWKITNVLREEGVFLYFDENYHGHRSIETIKTEYLDLMREAYTIYEEERTLVNQDLIMDQLAGLQTDYDRLKAVEYAKAYALRRNSQYDSYESNCVNFVSQCLYAGGIKMDYEGYMQWKYYSFDHNESDGQRGYSYSFTYIPSFVDYLYNGNILCELDSTLYLGNIGDIISIDYENCELSEMAHVLIISEVVRNEKDEICDYLVCGNTNDQLNYPLSALSYPYKKLIRIFGNK